MASTEVTTIKSAAGNCINTKSLQGVDGVSGIAANDELGCGSSASDQVDGDTPLFVSTSSFAEINDGKGDASQNRNETPMQLNGVALIAPITSTTTAVFGFDRKLLLCRRFKDSEGILRNFNSLPLFLYATSNTTHAISADGIGVGREVGSSTATTLGGMNDSYHLALCAGSVNDANVMNCLPLANSTLDTSNSNITLHPMATTATSSAMVAGATPSIAATLYQQHLNLNHHHNQLMAHHTPYAVNNHPYHLHSNGNQLLQHQHVHTEQTKSLQELQHEVGALLEFRDLVIETFPDLKHKMASISSSSGSAAATAPPTTLGGVLATGSGSAANTLTASGLMSGTSNASSRREWEPGIRIKRKLSQKDPPSNTTVVNSSAGIVAGGAAAVPPAVGELSSSSLSRSRSNSHSGKKEPKSGENNNGSVIQDSGFSTETSSSKEGHSASSTNGALTTAIASNRVVSHDSDDELMNLLDVIHRKSSRLRDEVERLQTYERQSFQRTGKVDANEASTSIQSRSLRKSASTGISSNSSKISTTAACLTPRTFREHVDRINKEDIKQLRKERDRLLEKLAEMEAETLTGRIRATELNDQVEELINIKKDLEEQLKLAMAQKLELSSRLQQLQQQQQQQIKGSSSVQSEYSPGQRLNFLSSAAAKLSRDTSLLDASLSFNTPARNSANFTLSTFHPVAVEQQHIDSSAILETTNRKSTSFQQNESSDNTQQQQLGRLDGIVSTPGGRNSKCRVTDSKRFQAILLETNVIELQRHLLTLTVQNQVLTQKLEQSAKSKGFLVKRLDRSKEDAEDLRFQLEEKNIELEGTKAQLRVLESRMNSSSIVSAGTSYTHSQNDYEANRSSASTTLMLSRRGDLNFADSRSSTPISSTHILPTSTPTQISTPSMKAMTHIPMDEVQQHSSSTESTHDLQQEIPLPMNKVMSASVGGTSPFAVTMQQQQQQTIKRPLPVPSKPSKIPLPGTKTTTFFPGKPPTGRPYKISRSPPSANTSTASHLSTSSSSKSSLSRSTGNLMCIKSSSNSLKRTDSTQSIRRETGSSLSTNTSRSSTSSIPMPNTTSYSTRTTMASTNPSQRVHQNSPLPKPKRDSLTSRVRHLDSLSRVHQLQSHGTDTNLHSQHGGGGKKNATTSPSNSTSDSHLGGSAAKSSFAATPTNNAATHKEHVLSSSSFSHSTQQFLRRATGSSVSTNTTSSTSTLSTMRRFSSASTMGRRISATEKLTNEVGNTSAVTTSSTTHNTHSDQHNNAHSTDSDSGKVRTLKSTFLGWLKI